MPYKQRPHSINKTLCLLDWGCSALAEWGMQPSTAILSSVDLGKDICAHVWKYDMTQHENYFKSSDQKKNWLLKEVAQIFPATCVRSLYLENQMCFEWAGGKGLSKALWSALTLGPRWLTCMPEQFPHRDWPGLPHSEPVLLCFLDLLEHS
jgi:hypothetical protein